jgi:hypothetical protein
MLDITRQLDILPAAALSGRHVDLIGVGGIGSWTALALGKATGGGLEGFSMRLCDGDTTDGHNVASQFYSVDDATHSKFKVHAAREHLCRFAGLQPEVVPAFLNGGGKPRLRDIVVVTVDTMADRHTIWEEYVQGQARVSWLIDARMGAESGTILTVRINDFQAERFYESTLYDDDEALDLPCTGRAIVYNGLWLAALITRQVKRILLGQEIPSRIDFDLDVLTLIVT